MFPDNITRDEAAARSALISTDSYQVLVDLSGRAADGSPLGAPEQHFVTTSTLRFTSRAGSSHVDLIADALVSATLDGATLDPATFADSRLPIELTEGDHELIVTAVHRYSRSGLGLHRFVDPADGRIYLYTQFEVAEARRMFACFEQPDLKATWQLSVIAPADWTVISNAAAVEPSPLDEGIARWDFEPTLRLSTYLTALVAGHYHVHRSSHTGRGGEIPMSLLCRQSKVADLDAEAILQLTRDGFEVFEEHFGVAYPFGSYDQAFVPEYNMGAMENAGCVTIRDEYLFRSRVTAATYESRINTILHELAHMWFGDLVTMTWWDDLWLNESFAEWASHFAQGEIADPIQPWATFCNARKLWAYRQDQLPTTHPIAADMHDLEAVEQNFDGITYAKGASALRQLVAFVGRDAFLAGIRAYFAAHAFGNTTLDDLLAALAEASGRDLSQWSAQWLETTGVNTLSAEFTLDEEGRYASFAVRQSADPAHPTLREHRLAIGLYSLSGPDQQPSTDQQSGPDGSSGPGSVEAALSRIDQVELDITGELTEVPDLVGRAQPDLLLLNDDDLTYAKIRFDERSAATLVGHIQQLDSALARALCWGAAWDECRDAEMSSEDYLELVLRGIGSESDLTAVQRVLGQVQTAITRYSPRSRTRTQALRLTQGLAQLLQAAEPGSDHQLAFATALARTLRTERGAELLQAWLAGVEVPPGLEIDTDLRWRLVIELSRLGGLDETAIALELQRDNTIAGAEQAAEARASRPDAEAKEYAWALAVDDPEVPNETQLSLCVGFWRVDQEDLCRPYVARYRTMCEDISAARGVWASKGLSLQNNAVTYLFPVTVADQTLVSELEQWRASAELSEPVRRILDERLDDARRALRAQQA